MRSPAANARSPRWVVTCMTVVVAREISRMTTTFAGRRAPVSSLNGPMRLSAHQNIDDHLQIAKKYWLRRTNNAQSASHSRATES